MPTQRLYQDDRNKIKQAFHNQLERIPASHPFPVQAGDLRGYYLALVPDEVHEAFATLERYQRDTHNRHINANWKDAAGRTWYVEFWTRIPEHDGYQAGVVSARVDLGDMPRLNYFMDESHADWPAIVEWAYEYSTLTDRIQEAYRYVEYCVKHCNTAGQLQRLIPESIHYLPNSEVKRSILNAERRSRMPVNFTRNTTKQEQLVDLMVLASLCPPDKGWAPFATVKCHRPKKEAP